jgi:hypothetical protein
LSRSEAAGAEDFHLLQRLSIRASASPMSLSTSERPVLLILSSFFVTYSFLSLLFPTTSSFLSSLPFFFLIFLFMSLLLFLHFLAQHCDSE